MPILPRLFGSWRLSRCLVGMDENALENAKQSAYRSQASQTAFRRNGGEATFGDESAIS